jgi:RimJ/RimL family protein N-acetyltransferase
MRMGEYGDAAGSVEASLPCRYSGRFAEEGYLTQRWTVSMGKGWLDAPEVRAMFDAESPERWRDIDGPESDDLVKLGGWAFTEEPVFAALWNEAGKVVAVGWVASTTRGLNLTYATASSVAGMGLAAAAVSVCILRYAQGVDQVMPPTLTVHAQFDEANAASEAVAAKLGLQPQAALGFDADWSGRLRRFEGREALFSVVCERAQAILAGFGDRLAWQGYVA